MVVKEELVKCAQIEGRGRGLVTTRPILAGEVVLRESPSLLYLSGSASRGYCRTCLRSCPPSSALPCPGCQCAVFCSSACRSSHSARLCAALPHVEAAGVELDAEDQARFLLAAYDLALVSPSEFEKVLSLGGDPLTEDERVSRLHASLSDAVRCWPWGQRAQGKEIPPALEVTAALLRIDACNAFGHMAPCATPGERSVRGCGIYLTASLLNHDCFPNACRFDYLDSPGDSNTDIVVRALHDIPENVEVTISYFPIDWSLQERQGRLAEEYGFNCLCDRCAIEQNWSDDDEDSADEDDCENETSQNETNHRKIATGKGHSFPDTMVNGEPGGAELTKEDDENDVRHALFFVKYLCPVEECGGTMAPLPPSQSTAPVSDIRPQEFLLTMECNMCGHIRTGDEFDKDVHEHGIG